MGTQPTESRPPGRLRVAVTAAFIVCVVVLGMSSASIAAPAAVAALGLLAASRSQH